MTADPTEEGEVAPKKPSKAGRSKKGGTAKPRGRPRTSLASMLDRALDTPVEIDLGGERRKMTKRDVVIAQLVDRSAGADLRATKLLLDMLHKLERSADAAAASPGSEDDVYALLREKLARLALAQEAEARAATDGPHSPEDGEGDGRLKVSRRS